MLYRKMSYPLPLVGLLLLCALWLLPGQSVEAQCGSQASSCKNCHEVQGELPVNNDSTGWHESHAFGDFCYICHAGNQQATDMDESHAGMVPPLSDVNASCQMCHADDVNERAEVYAVALGIDLNAGSEDSSTAVETSEQSSEDFWGAAPADTTVSAESSETLAEVHSEVETCPTSNIVANQDLVVDDASMVNYEQRYNEIVLGQRPVNWGNVALGAMIGLLVLGGGGFVVFNEIRANTALGELKQAEGEYPEDLVEMLPALARMKIQTRRSLKKALANPKQTEKILELIDTLVPDDDTEESDQ